VFLHSMVRHKVRIRFRKAGDLRLVSHHDLLRCFERMLRRARLPFQSSQGFNPRPRLVFALSLPLGVIGCAEVADLELSEDVDPAEVLVRLAAQAPPGLEILEVCRTDARVAPQVCAATYRVDIPVDRRDGLCERIAALLAAPDCWVERTRPHPRRFDLRPYVAGLRLVADTLELDLRVTPKGMARPDEVLEVLGLGDLLLAGAVMERTRIELTEENSPPHIADGRLPIPDCRPAPQSAIGDLRSATNTPSSAAGVRLPGGADSQEGIA
jgi:radical SAM-linked protein